MWHRVSSKCQVRLFVSSQYSISYFLEEEALETLLSFCCPQIVKSNHCPDSVTGEQSNEGAPTVEMFIDSS